MSRPRPHARSRRLHAAGLAAAASLLPAGLAPAQEVAKAAEKSEWLSLVVGFGLVVIVGVGAFLGSKRGHLD